MRCANSECSRDLLDLPGGSVWLMQLEMPTNSSGHGYDGFPICTQPTKYFWLCAECSRHFVLLRWTPFGLIPGKNQSVPNRTAAVRLASSLTSTPFSVHVSFLLEEEFLDVD